MRQLNIEEPNTLKKKMQYKMDEKINELIEDRYYLYLYCIAPQEAASFPGEIILSGLPDSSQVYGVVYGQVTAVVSDVPAELYNEIALEECLQNLDWLESHVTAHNFVIQRVMQEYPVVPMKFCTIFKLTENLKQVITGREKEFSKLLKYVSNKEEWGLKAYFEKKLWQRYVEETSENIQEAKKQLKAGGSGAAYLIKRRLDELVLSAMDHLAAETASQTHLELSPFAIKAKLNPLMSSKTAGQLKTMVLNAAYLIEKDNVASFTHRVNELRNSYLDKGFEIVVSGPWPPYNFSSVEGLGSG